MASTATIKFWPKVLISQTTTVGEGEGGGPSSSIFGLAANYPLRFYIDIKEI